MYFKPYKYRKWPIAEFEKYWFMRILKQIFQIRKEWTDGFLLVDYYPRLNCQQHLHSNGHLDRHLPISTCPFSHFGYWHTPPLASQLGSSGHWSSSIIGLQQTHPREPDMHGPIIISPFGHLCWKHLPPFKAHSLEFGHCPVSEIGRLADSYNFRIFTLKLSIWTRNQKQNRNKSDKDHIAKHGIKCNKFVSWIYKKD